jgi:hypothetical protein
MTVNGFKAENVELRAEIRRLSEKIERLRAAIERIYQCSAQKHVREIARAALTETSDE